MDYLNAQPSNEPGKSNIMNVGNLIHCVAYSIVKSASRITRHFILLDTEFNN